MKDYYYHETEWLSFWKDNQSEISDDENDWVSPEDLAFTFYSSMDEMMGEITTPVEDTIYYSAGVYLGEITLDD